MQKKVDNTSQKTPHVQKSESVMKTKEMASPRKVKRVETTPVVASVKLNTPARPDSTGASAVGTAAEPVVKKIHTKAKVHLAPPTAPVVCASPLSSTVQQRTIAQVWLLTTDYRELHN